MKKARMLAVLLLASALTAACGQTAKTNEASNDPSAAVGNAETASAPAEQKLTVRYYVTDDEMSELRERTTDISFTDKKDQYLEALKALQLESGDGDYSLWKNAVFHTAELKDGKLTVDLSLPDTARLGAPGEDMALQAIEKAAFQFEEVQSLDILVDGKAVESLMGHEELEHPIVKSP